MNKKRNEYKLSNSKEGFGIYILLGIIILLPISLVGNEISDLIIDYNLLVGYIIGTVFQIISILPIFALLLYFSIVEIKSKKQKTIKNKERKTSWLIYIIVIIIGVLLFSIFKNLISGIKDSFQGTKVMYLYNYEIKKGSKKRLSLDRYFVIYFDENGEKNELSTTQYMGLYDYDNKYKNSILKIKYYENIKMIESFEYLGKKS